VLPAELGLGPPVVVKVPKHPARTPTSLALKNALWPTVFAPRRKGEPDPWARAKVSFSLSTSACRG
jgi:tRNA-specific adenosine deaminase 3